MNTNIYRLDTFLVPKAAREEFFTRVEQTHDMLRAQPGFVQDMLLEKPADGEKFVLATLVEWQDGASLENARKAITAAHQAAGFSPQALFDRLGIEAETGTYTCARSR